MKAAYQQAQRQQAWNRHGTMFLRFADITCFDYFYALGWRHRRLSKFYEESFEYQHESFEVCIGNDTSADGFRDAYEVSTNRNRSMVLNLGVDLEAIESRYPIDYTPRRLASRIEREGVKARGDYCRAMLSLGTRGYACASMRWMYDNLGWGKLRLERFYDNFAHKHQIFAEHYLMLTAQDDIWCHNYIQTGLKAMKTKVDIELDLQNKVLKTER